ncbi:MAG: glycosyltransferase family 4 protein [Myxococcota bacterium]|nr:glycosyltransferase family 4 protein [Myxococcota bacterium]
MNRPLRITQAAAFPFPSPQGSQVFVRGMARALARRGHEVTVVCYAHGDGREDPEYRVVRTPRIPGYENMRAGPDWVKPLLDVALAARIAAVPADVVHAHNYEAPIAAYLVRRRTGVPVVYNAHNTMGEELPTYFHRPWVRNGARAAGRWLDRSVPRRADHSVVLNQAAVRTLKRLGCDAVSMVPPGIDAAELEGVHDVPLEPGPWVVYAGNPDRYQDLDVLVRAMRRIPHIGLLMVSASPLSDWKDCGLERLKLVETGDFDEVKSWVAAADVAAIPRTVCSGFPIKLLNFLGLGLPTVVAAGSAQPLPGVVEVPNGDATAMANAIDALVADRQRRETLGAFAQAHVRDACTWDARARELESIYHRVIAGADGPRF